MARSDVTCEGENFYCYSLAAAGDGDYRDMDSFEPVDRGGASLARYLQIMSLADEDRGTMRTYLVRDRGTGELAGYFSLKAGMVSLGESDTGDRTEFDTLPGIELANFAVNGRYRSAHPASRGCGRVIFRELVTEVASRAAGIVGACLLYIYSLPMKRVIENYGSYGFVRLPREDEELLHARLKPRYDMGCVFMYMPMPEPERLNA